MTKQDKLRVNNAIEAIPLDGSKEVVIKDFSSNRTHKQNKLMYMWHSEYAIGRGETKEWAARYFKLRHVLPIVQRDFKPDYVELIDRYLEFARQDKKLMRAFLDNHIHTSSLSTKQLAEALNEYDMTASQQGILFTHPEDLYRKAVYGC